MSSEAPSTGSKRKRRDAGPRFYAVRTGMVPGIYQDYGQCLDQVKGYKNAQFKSFSSLPEAEHFLKHGPMGSGNSKGPQKFYGVRSGRVPGVYTDWDSASAQVTGWQRPKYKSFSTRAEAEAFVKDRSVSETLSTAVGGTPDRDGKSKAPPTKKARKSATTADSKEYDETLEPGTAPLPASAEDGFDTNVILNGATGKIEYKNDIQRTATKMHAVGPADGSVLRVYTDGSALGNGGKGAIAGVGVYFGPQDSRNVSEALGGQRQTNQRAELTAIQRAIEIAPRDRDVKIYTDSSYGIKCVTDWCHGWRRNGWLTSARKPVENKDLVEVILLKIEERTKLGSETTFEWLKGHANDPGNVAADELAVKGAREARTKAALAGAMGPRSGSNAS